MDKGEHWSQVETKVISTYEPEKPVNCSHLYWIANTSGLKKQCLFSGPKYPVYTPIVPLMISLSGWSVKEILRTVNTVALVSLRFLLVTVLNQEMCVSS